ncbi:MAG: hypothetical protein IKK95_03095, partial [Lachnospiraceae bacterium]|nr:hypothetical protein [Lachnospiraceae bacterium]
LLTDMENSGATVTLANIEKMVGGPAEVEVKPGASVFDTSEIDIVGANLNLKQNASGDPITLILDKPDEEHVIPERFDSAVSVKFSMSVTDVKNPKQLEVPVKITLPVPENINPEYLVIIHYHQDGTWTQEWPYVYEEDGKTYADFVLTSFSDFVLAEDVLEGGTPNTPENGGGQPDDGNQGEIGGSEEQPTYHESKETIQKIQKKEESIPEYVESGSWTSEDGKWTFADNNGEIYKNKWAAVVNPYANTEAGQFAFDWFFFDANGHMMTGWIFDGGRWYYLNPLSDGTQGRMMTGWQMINGLWYYLNPVSDGTKGAMLADAWIDNYYVDANGVWDETKTK